MKKTILFLTLALYFSQNIRSQNTRANDSLKRVLKAHKAEDSIKVDILTELHENLMFSNPIEAKKYAELELEISEKINYQRGIGKGLMHLGNFYTNRNNTDSALYYYNKAKLKFYEINNSRGIVFVNYSISDLERSKGHFNTAISILEDNLKLINENEKNPIGKIKFSAAQINSLATIYMEKGNYEIAIIEAHKALDMFSQIEDKIRMADVLKLLGDLEFALENFTSALKHYDDAIIIFDEFKDNIYKSYALNAAAKTLYKMGRTDEAETYYNKAVILSRENEASFTLSDALYGLSIIYTNNKDLEKAYKLLEESKKITLKEDYKIGQIAAFKGLSKIYALKNQSDLALFNINQALKIAKDIGTMSYLQETLELRSEIHEQRFTYQKALNDLKSAKKINDSLFSIKKTQRIEELKTIYETEKKEAAITLQNLEIKTLNEEAKNDKLTKTLYAGGMFSFLALSGLLYFGFKQRIKKSKIEREKQEAIYKQEIAFKKKELASQTLHLVQKNTFIQELKENLEKIKQSPELFKIEFRRLVMLLKKESAEDKDWEVFKSYFAEVHNNFDNQLKAIYADISQKEIRLASFLRMNLSTKEIASMLNVLPDSVLKSKYRLKKKLNLAKDDNLNTFLNSL